MPKPTLVPTTDVAAQLGRDVRTIHRWVESGRLPHAAKTPGRRGAYLFDPKDVARLAAELEAEAATEEAAAK